MVVSHTLHLRTFRDGWRTLRFFLLYEVHTLVLYSAPGLLLVLLGVAGYVLALPGISVFRADSGCPHAAGGKSDRACGNSVAAVRGLRTHFRRESGPAAGK